MLKSERPEVLSSLPRFAPLLVLVCVGVCVALSLFVQRSPRPLPANAPADQFSAERALVHIREIAQRPHPLGSPDNARVHDYLAGAIRSMGYEPVLRPTQLLGNDQWPNRRAYHTENVLVRVPGTAPTKAIVLMGHYDSTPYGPGAADDGAAVASMLESLRALKHSPPLKNDVIFAFTDGEEGGLLGAKAFLQDPWYKDVGMAINFEARGHYGSSLMFETSQDNAFIAREFLKGAPYPVASSLMFDIAGRMPTTTDYEILKKDGIPGIGFAFIGGLIYYHTRNDNPDNLSLASLQHHGSYALPLARHFGNLDLSGLKRIDLAHPTKDNVVYFNTLGFHTAHYPVSWVWPLTGLLCLLFVGVIALGITRNLVTVRGMLMGVIMLLAGILAAALFTGLIVFIGFLLHQEYVLYRSYEYLYGFLALSLAIIFFIFSRFERWARSQELALGAIAWWVALCLFMTAFFPGGSFLFQWPAVFVLIALGLVFILYGRVSNTVSLLLLLAGAAPSIILFSPTLLQFFQALTIVFSPGLFAVVVLVSGLLVPGVLVLKRPNRWWFSGISLACALPILALALYGRPFSSEYPKMNSLCYAMNWDTGQAFWLTSDSRLDTWTRSFFSKGAARESLEQFLPNDMHRYLKAPAPMWSFDQPQMNVLDDQTQNGERTLHLKVVSPRKAAEIELFTKAPTEVLSASLNGMLLGEGKKAKPPFWRLHYRGFSGDGLDLVLTVPENNPVNLVVREKSFGLDGLPGVNIPARPSNMITEPNTIRWWRNFRSEAAYSVKTFSL
ncbi:MAG TPA: M20/M25/M40 family metallo-hydrolase [Candidatus Hydrogenedentes bacterium]|nr:M20/M25/M40 family metallo-hydrolase [Candidatus Hydrogenedentota bacterium]